MKEGEEPKHISIVMQAQRLAYEGRKQPAEDDKVK